jgi:hypothetical protein
MAFRLTHTPELSRQYDLTVGRKTIKTVRAVLGYTIAALSIPLMLFSFLGAAGGLDEVVAEASGLRIAPDSTGGEVVETIDHGAYQTHVHL